MKQEYEQHLKDKTEENGAVKLDGEKVLEIKYTHYPNVVGPRSRYKGLPIWVGKTEAVGTIDGEVKKVESMCWVNEPFTYERARYVCTGRLLKAFGLPTSLADQIKE